MELGYPMFNSPVPVKYAESREEQVKVFNRHDRGLDHEAVGVTQWVSSQYGSLAEKSFLTVTWATDQ